MTAPTGSEVDVEAPELEEPITGLLAQVPVISGPQADRWLAGMSFSPGVAGIPEFRDLCSTGVMAGTNLRVAARYVHPFELIVHDRCSTFGWTEANYVERATDALEVKRHWGVEREWEKGELIPGNLHLAATYTSPNPTTVILAGGVDVSAANGLALLDEEIGNSDNVVGRGMIFCTPFVNAQWKAAGLLSDMETVDGRTVILSPAGNYVVVCGGLEGRGPAGTVPAAHASQWAYATDPIVVVAGTPQTFPDTLLEALKHDHNEVTYRQEQWFAILWGGLLHAAVNISTETPADTGGGGGGGGGASTNTTTFFTEDDTPLGANATRNGATRAANGYSRFRAFATADVAGTLSVQQSADGVVWHTTVAPVAVPANTPTVLESIVSLPYVRAVYVNGATIQTSFDFASALVAI